MNEPKVGDKGVCYGPKKYIPEGQKAFVTIIRKRGDRFTVRDECGYTWTIESADFTR